MVHRRRRNYRNRVYSNLKLYLDMKLIERGWYDNIASGETDWHGNNQSQQLPVQTDPLYPVDSGTTVHVWQGYRRNWITESGMQPFASGLTTPTIARSIYIGGVEFNSQPFREGNATSGVAIDHRNGRVIIESGIPAASTIEIAHSYKEVWVDTIARDLITTQVTAIDNTKRIVINNVPSGEVGQLPMVLMEIARDPSPAGRQLGGGLILKKQIFLHIITNNRWDKDELIDFIQQRKDEAITMVDLDAAPSQFTHEGDFDTGWMTYRNLQVNWEDKKLYVMDVEMIENDDIGENGYFTAVLRMDTEIWLNEDL